MKLQKKIGRLNTLKKEISVIRKDLQTEMFDFVMDQFRNKGFIDSKVNGGEDYRSLYHPKTKVNIRVGNISTNSVSIMVIPMSNKGLNWGDTYKVQNLSFKYPTQTFEKFYGKSYKDAIDLINK
jgi:hypothetical protein